MTGLTAEQMIDMMDANGIARSVLFTIKGFYRDMTEEGNDELADVIRRYPDRFVAFGTVQPGKGEAALAEMDRCAKMGIRGFKFQPVWQGLFVNTPAFHPIMEKLRELKLPVFIHSGTPPVSEPFQIINVAREYDGLVDGVWLQDHTGTIDSAAEAARATEQANSNRITVAVVDDLGYSEPNYAFRTALKRLDIALNLTISGNRDNIQFIEKEPWRSTEPFTGGCDMYPNYMIKDGVEYFMFNRRSDQGGYESEADKACKAQLLANGGMFFRRYGYVETPYEYLRNVIERHHSFETFSHKEVEWFDDGKFCDFHGNLKEVSAAFMYRIYDKELAANIEKIVGLIHHKKYNEALDALNEGPNAENVKRSSSLASKIESASIRATEAHHAEQQPVKALSFER